MTCKSPDVARPMIHAPWNVLLIGGASGLGKSTVARAIAREADACLCEADDVRMALQAVTTAAEQSALHFFVSAPGVARERIWDLPPEQLRDGLISVGDVVSRALEPIVGHHVARNKRVVIEGDGILPAYAARWRSDLGDAVRAVFLTAPEQFFTQRHVPLEGAEAAERHVREQVNWLFAQWLGAEANRHGVSVVPAVPWEGLIRRIRDAVEEKDACKNRRR